MADLFKTISTTRAVLTTKFESDKVDVADERCFVGWDAYKNLWRSRSERGVLATPAPGFARCISGSRRAGKHIFAEKTGGRDAPGVRSALQTCEEAKKKTCRSLRVMLALRFASARPCRRFTTAASRNHRSAITYNAHGLWMIPRKPEWSDMEGNSALALLHLVSGDHNVDNISTAWTRWPGDARRVPVKASGIGPASANRSRLWSNLRSHFVVTNTPMGPNSLAACRQQNGAPRISATTIMGPKHLSRDTTDLAHHKARGKRAARPGNRHRRAARATCISTSTSLIDSIRAGKPIITAIT